MLNQTDVEKLVNAAFRVAVLARRRQMSKAEHRAIATLQSTMNPFVEMLRLTPEEIAQATSICPQRLQDVPQLQAQKTHATSMIIGTMDNMFAELELS